VPQEPEFETFSVRLTREMADQFRAVAEREDRPIAAELRRLIRQRIDEERAAA
jgi:predicted DNA-binding protein